MNHIRASFFKKQIIYLVFLIIFSILIWVYGPLIAIENNAVLQLPEKRLYVISICFLLWMLKIIALDIEPSGKEIPRSPSAETEKKRERLQGRFVGALHFLKKTFITKHGKRSNLANLPWYLVIGPTGSGKTNLLAHSGVNFILAKQFKKSCQVASGLCDWWATRDLVLVDMPGDYLTKSSVEDPLDLWKYFLNLIRQFNITDRLQGIVVALNLPEMMKNGQLNKKPLLAEIQKTVAEIKIILGKQVPIHLVITKCDLLPGFNEFFSELGSDELAQAWGMVLAPSPQHEKMNDIVIARFNHLIKRINKQLITRLHHERNPHTRSYIKDFPLHLERLKEALGQLIQSTFNSEYPLHSLYLTSGAQPISQERPPYSAGAAPGQYLKMMTAPPPPQRTYFVRHLLLHHLLLAPPLKANSKSAFMQWQRPIAYAAAIITIISAAVLLGHDFVLSVERTQAIQHGLAQYPLRMRPGPDQKDYLLNVLPLLNALQEAANQPADKLLLKFYSTKSQRIAAGLYQHALQTIVLPKIKTYFETYLQASADKNPEQVYAVLKAYLMLANQEKFEVEYLAKILKNFLPPTAKKDNLNQLAYHVRSIVNALPRSLVLNTDLITKVRKQLTNLSNSTLGFILLKNMENNNVDSLVSLGTYFGNPPVFTSQVVETQIPSMFTAKEFSKITTTEIDQAAQEVVYGNWALGHRSIIADPAAIHSLAEQLRTQYIANYIDIWESLLANLELTTPKNLAQISEMLDTMTGSNSPLLQVLDTIRQNTAFLPVTTASPKLQSLSILLMEANKSQTSLLYQVFISLKQLSSYLKFFTQTNDPATATVAATAKRMLNNTNDPISQMHTIAEQSPGPMKNWLHTLATQTWKYMLLASSQVIEKAWENSIMLTYKTQMQDHYPFDLRSSQEVDLLQFTKFFGLQGQLTHFYQAYLKPFVDEKNNWHWRSVDDGKLPLSEIALQQLEQTTHIQQAFFPNADNKLYVPFSLQPIAIDKKMKGFMLNINGQEMHYEKGLPGTERLIIWPGLNTQHATTVNFISPTNALLTKTIAGNWGWFKLIEQATQGIKSNKEIILNFNIDGHTAKYILLTQGHFNPFLPLNLHQLALPEKLARPS